MLETDPVTIKTSAAGDIVIANGRTSLAAGLDAAVIGATTRMRLILGEWFLNLGVGVPWLERPGVSAARAILGQRYNAAKLRSEMRRAILRTPGITEITRLEVSFAAATRTATVTWRARCVFGDTDLNTLEVAA